MAFTGIIFMMILFVTFAVMIVSFIVFFILKLTNRKKEKKSLKIASTVFLILGIICSIPTLFVIVMSMNRNMAKINTPDGKTQTVKSETAQHILELCRDGSDEAVDELKNELDKNPHFVFYYDVNRYSVLDIGLKESNPEIVRLALSYGAFFDNPEKYEHMAYVHTSMEEFISNISKDITENDLEILQILFENGASPQCDCCANKPNSYYSNILGQAAWKFLYNGNFVTDNEIRFLEKIVDNGITKDSNFKYYTECSFVDYGIETNIVKNSNYKRLVEIIGRESVKE